MNSLTNVLVTNKQTPFVPELHTCDDNSSLICSSSSTCRRISALSFTERRRKHQETLSRTSESIIWADDVMFNSLSPCWSILRSWAFLAFTSLYFTCRIDNNYLCCETVLDGYSIKSRRHSWPPTVRWSSSADQSPCPSSPDRTSVVLFEGPNRECCS